MRVLLLSAVVLAAAIGSHAWGGVFNRFSPEALNNMAFSGHEGHYPYSRMEDYGSSVDTVGNRLEEAVLEAAECYNALCWDHESCCPGFVCLDSGDEYGGRCLPGSMGRKMGELCSRDSQCDAGLLCVEIVPGEPRVCRPPTPGHKQYNQDCSMSNECDITRGLCCVVQRRHRQKPRKACSYFKDPLTCIGHVAIDQIKTHVEHTAGEKRMGFFKRLP